MGPVGFPVPRGGHLPLRAAWLFLFCVSLEVFATPTRRYHGGMLIHPYSPCVRHPMSERCLRTHAGSGPSRVRHRLLCSCLGDPIPLAKHIRHGKCTGSCSEVPHCPVTKDRWDCVLNVPEKLRNKLLFLKNQCNIGIFFSYLLFFLPSILSTYCQTNEESVGTDFEDFLQFSKIELLHLFLDAHVVSPSSLVKSRQILFCGFAFAFDRHARSFASSFNAYSSS